MLTDSRLPNWLVLVGPKTKVAKVISAQLTLGGLKVKSQNLGGGREPNRSFCVLTQNSPILNRQHLDRQNTALKIKAFLSCPGKANKNLLTESAPKESLC